MVSKYASEIAAASSTATIWSGVSAFHIFQRHHERGKRPMNSEAPTVANLAWSASRSDTKAS